MNEKELSMLTQIGVLIEEAIKRWETDSKPALIHKMKEDLIAEIRSQIKLVNANSGRGLSKDEVEQMIHSALGVYDSDKTGLADFALEPAGMCYHFENSLFCLFIIIVFFVMVLIDVELVISLFFFFTNRRSNIKHSLY